jgi:ParB family chromosome partitioning protein
MAKLTILKNPQQAKANNTTVRESFRVSPDTLTQRPPFQGLYQIDPDVLERITSHMRANGYDNGQPITVWRHELEDGEEERVVVDGHTRLQAARDLGLLEVTVVYRSFSSTRAALEYAIHNQRDRRNLSDAEIVGLVEMVDRPVTGFKGDAPIATPGTIGEKPVRTADITAAAIGVGRGKVEEARTVLSDPEVKEKVKAGAVSIHAGAQEVKAKRSGKSRKKAKPPAAAGVVTIQLRRPSAVNLLLTLQKLKGDRQHHPYALGSRFPVEIEKVIRELEKALPDRK